MGDQGFYAAQTGTDKAQTQGIEFGVREGSLVSK